MIVSVLKNVGQDCFPDEVEVETEFAVGDKVRICFDWCERKPAMYGVQSIWHKAEAVVEIKEIVCNMLSLPAKTWLFISSQDPKWMQHCGTNTVGVSEELLKERLVR